jgi:hypothetical protein
MKCLSGTNGIWLYPSGDHKYYPFLNFYPEDGSILSSEMVVNYYHRTQRHLTKGSSL